LRERRPARKGWEGEGVRCSKQAFFFEKKNQKTFILGCMPADGRAAEIQKFFVSFFSKKKSFLKCSRGAGCSTDALDKVRETESR
jgi:hypothetical protein